MKRWNVVLSLVLTSALCGTVSAQVERDLGRPWQRSKHNLLSGFGNMYNPHVLRVPDPVYPYRMYFFGWARADCNPGYSGCDAIYLARSKNPDGPWKVYSGSQGWLGDDRINLWVPVLTADDKFYDQWHNGDPSVVYHEGLYYMAYSATGFDKDGINPHDPRTGAQDTDGFISVVMGATSKDGIHWSRALYPLLIYEPEIGRNEGDYTDPNYQGNFHRPSLMWDEDHWRMWFDYWQLNNGGLGLGHAECRGDPMKHSDWVITHDLDQPLIKNWPNPDVIKIGRNYYSVADPSGYPGKTGWPARQICQALSADGLHWKILGFIRPDDDTPANHVPEAFLEARDDQAWLYLFYACQIGGDPYDYRYDRIRYMKKPVCLP